MFIIGYDISVLQGTRLTGVEKLAKYLFAHLWKLTPEHQHVLFCHTAPSHLSLPENVKICEVPKGKLWRYTNLPIYIRRNKCQIFISPVAALPGFCGIPKLAYIHECPWLHDCAEKISWKHRTALWLAALRCEILLTNSQCTKEDIKRELPFSPKQIKIIPPAADPFDKTMKKPLHEVFGHYGIPQGNYCLFVSTIRPKKNIQLLLETFQNLPEINLICVGKIQDASIINNKPKNVFFTGYAPQEDLLSLYEGAQCFLYVSRNEGFGIPILEAFAHGCPVVASRCGSIPEVAGDAACYIESWKSDELRSIIINLINDSNQRQIMIQKGKIQANKYNWETSAQHLFQLVENVLNRK
ncbi:glycosyltransferase family 4 protein [Candidatus Uabimicrobium amorphum]|uniref:Group 1 glycosyl transferase n=1 Tax=Uabimicrobium amorphum TaxID=2596890 RepID=A0A5S9IN30_UABAM|nr:glycosyltransferase family 1 protein [Candidatus Uabimicrobium amorphum]BBM84928.1 group 1 glycosyl transferase [Candidatus Uabimicrobium amorphum]